jgi:molybdate transport system substrate-binding protein
MVTNDWEVTMVAVLRRLLLCIAIAVPLGPASAQEARPLVVFAAASLQTALNAVAAEWQREAGQRVTLSYAASSALARQLEQGAPADLFASADLDWMDWAEQRDLVRRDSRRNLLGNALVLIAAREDAVDLTIAPGFPLAAAIGTSRLATGNPDAVPVGRYARQALTALGVWAEVAPRIAGADNVRAALALVARGEARFGIVYRTDAMTEPRVRVVGTFPAGSHPPVVYPVAVTASSRHPQAAAFLAFLSSPAAIRLFEAEGFTILR